MDRGKRRQIIDAGPSVSRRGQKAVRAETRAEEAKGREARHHHLGRDESNADNAKVTRCVLFFGLVLGLGLIDTYFLSPAAALIARQMLPYHPVWTTVFTWCFRLILPLTAIWLEAYAGSTAFSHGPNGDAQPRSQAVRVAALTGGVLLAVAIVTVVITIDRALNAVDGGSGAFGGIRQFFFYATAAFSFLGHVFLVTSGWRGEEAKRYWRFAITAWLRRGTTRTAVTKHGTAHDEFQKVLHHYVHDLRDYNRAHADDPVPIGPFDAEVTDYIQRRFPSLAKGFVAASESADSSSRRRGVVVDLPRDRFKRESYPEAEN